MDAVARRQRQQGEAWAHHHANHPARRQRPAHAADPGGEVRGDDGTQAPCFDQPVDGKLKDRVGWQKACLALGHPHARIVWAMLVRGKRFDAGPVGAYPGAPAMPH
jgi:hypothetical protein